MKLIYSIPITLGFALTSAAQENNAQWSCISDSSQVCCAAHIGQAPKNDSANVCCDGSVIASSYNLTAAKTLLDVYNNITCCRGDSNHTTPDNLNAACTAGSPTPMRSLAASQGVATSVSIGIGYRPTAMPGLDTAAVIGVGAVVAWTL